MDIDLDLPTTFDPVNYFTCIPASMINKKNELSRHPAGVYFQNMPVDPISGLAAIPYDEADGFFKIDFLHLSLLDDFNLDNKEQLRLLMDTEPDWSMLMDEDVVGKLFQLKNHFVTLLRVQPTSVPELADAIAMVRPARKHLIQKYRSNVVGIRRELYSKPLPKGCFKRGHAIAYALMIVVQLHLIKAGLI